MIDCEQLHGAHSPLPIWFALDHDAYSGKRYAAMCSESSTVMQGSMVAPDSDFLTLQ